MTGAKVWFLFNRPRASRARQTLAGQWPGEGLYAFHQLREMGFDTCFSDAGHERTFFRRPLKWIEDLMSRRGRRVGFNLAQAWELRKELQRADIVFGTADSSALAALASSVVANSRLPFGGWRSLS